MSQLIVVSSPTIHFGPVTLKAASAKQRKAGLVGWLYFKLPGGVKLDGVILRRTSRGKLALSFPKCRKRTGRERPYVGITRRELERMVLRALKLPEAEDNDQR